MQASRVSKWMPLFQKSTAHSRTALRGSSTSDSQCSRVPRRATWLWWTWPLIWTMGCQRWSDNLTSRQHPTNQTATSWYLKIILIITKVMSISIGWATTPLSSSMQFRVSKESVWRPHSQIWSWVRKVIHSWDVSTRSLTKTLLIIRCTRPNITLRQQHTKKATNIWIALKSQARRKWASSLIAKPTSSPSWTSVRKRHPKTLSLDTWRHHKGAQERDKNLSRHIQICARSGSMHQPSSRRRAQRSKMTLTYLWFFRVSDRLARMFARKAIFRSILRDKGWAHKVRFVLTLRAQRLWWAT